MNPKSLVLAVETSSRIGSVAIAFGKKIIAETTFSAPIKHSAEIFPAIGDILGRFSQNPDNIKQIHISAGPGSFTGLRIAVTLAKTMHLANAVKIIAVDTLDVIAANANDYLKEKKTTTDSPERIATRKTSSTQKTDSNGTWEKILPDSLMTANQFLDQFTRDEKPIWLLGDGLLYYKDTFKADTIRFMDEKYWSPRASNVFLLGYEKALAGKFEDPLTLTPNYLLRPDIKIKTR